MVWIHYRARCSCAQLMARHHRSPRMMTSSNGNIFRVTGPLCGELMFFLIALLINGWVNNRECGWWFETPSRSLWRHCNVTETHIRRLMTSVLRHRRSGLADYEKKLNWIVITICVKFVLRLMHSTHALIHVKLISRNQHPKHASLEFTPLSCDWHKPNLRNNNSTYYWILFCKTKHNLLISMP